MPKKRFDVDVPEGQHLGLSRDTTGAYRGHLFDNETNGLVGHAELHEVNEDDERSLTTEPEFIYISDDDEPDQSPGFVGTLAVIGVTVAAVKAAQYIKDRREERRANAILSSRAVEARSQAATVEMPATQRARSSSSMSGVSPTFASVRAGWYVDTYDPTWLRYWNGNAWTEHVAPRNQTEPSAQATRAGWYVDAYDARRLRYWSGTAWTGYYAPRPGIVLTSAPAESNSFAGASQRAALPAVVESLGSAREPRISMTRAEWQRLVLAWLTAGAIEEDLWRKLSNSRIEDVDATTLEWQRAMEKLTAQQGAQRARLMLEANPALRDDRALREFMKIFVGEAPAEGHYVPRRSDKIKNALRLG